MNNIHYFEELEYFFNILLSGSLEKLNVTDQNKAYLIRELFDIRFGHESLENKEVP